MTSTTDVQRISALWLADHQDEETGGWSDRPGGAVNVLNTAEVIIALIDADSNPAIDIPDCKAMIQRGVDYLLKDKNRITDGEDAGAWPRFVDHKVNHKDVKLKCADLVRTATAVEALIAAHKLDEEPVRQALDWIVSLQTEDGGFRFTHASPSSKLLPTCYAMMALLNAYKASKEEAAAYEDAIKNGLAFIEKRQNNDGSFGEDEYMRAAHTIYAALVHQTARPVGGKVDVEREAIRWLKENLHEAIQYVQATATANDPHGSGEYVLVVMAETLLVRLLSGAVDSADRSSHLAEEAMIALHQCIEGTSGGCWGKLVFSWATAKVVSALGVAKENYKEIPKRTMNADQQPSLAGHLVLGFCAFVILVVFVLLLAKVDMPVWMPVLLFFLPFVVLLAYGFLGKDAFERLSNNLIGLLRPGTKKADDS